MKNAYFGVAIAALVLGQLGVVAHADTRDANCEVRKDGDKQKGKSGPCTFSQRQGYIDIDLKNGDSLRLSPTGGNQYKDQNHNKVHRVSSGANSEEFKWEGGKHVTVTFTGGYNNNGYNQYNNNNYNNNSSRENSDYQRGYQDGLAGRYDQYDHTQAYKNGVTAGEAAVRSNQGNQYNNGKHNNGKHNGGNNGDYNIEGIGNGDFEVKWSSGCIADYDRYGNSTGYTSCSQDMKQRSDQVARKHAK